MANLLDAATSRFEDGTTGKWTMSTGYEPYMTFGADTVHPAFPPYAPYEGSYSLKVGLPWGETPVAEYATFSFQMARRVGFDIYWDIDYAVPINPDKAYNFSVQYGLPSSTYAGIWYQFGFEYFDASFVNQGAVGLLAGTEDPTWIGQWNRLHIENVTVPYNAHYAALYATALSPNTSPPYWLTEGRWYDDFILEEYVPPSVPSAGAAAALRQRQNPLPVRATGGGGGGGGGGL